MPAARASQMGDREREPHTYNCGKAFSENLPFHSNVQVID